MREEGRSERRITMESTESRTFRLYGEKKVGVHNKFYEVRAEETETGAVAIYTWGRIGTAGQSKERYTGTFEFAKTLCKEQFAKKEKRGYRQVTALEALASCCEELEERNTNGLEPVDFDIPKFATGRSATDKRLGSICESFARKLNVVRSSRHDLSDDAYEKQAETVLLQFQYAFDRARATKTHGPSITAEATASMRAFYTLLQKASDVSYSPRWRLS
jgi:predicted DNA-binding WGR domain protein